MVSKIVAIVCLYGLCIVTTTSNVIKTSPEPSVHYLASKYTVVADVTASYYDATLACKKDGKELVSIETEDEWRDIDNFIISQGYTATRDQEQFFWTSANSLQKPHSKVFFWMSDGSMLPLYASYWAEGQPNNVNSNQFCVDIGAYNGKFKINDYYCAEKLKFICENKNTNQDNNSVYNNISYYNNLEISDKNKGTNDDNMHSKDNGQKVQINIYNSAVKLVVPKNQ